MSRTVHMGRGRSVTFNDDGPYQDETLAAPPRSESVRVTFDFATHARLKLIARAESKSLTDFIRGMAEERAKVQPIYMHGKHTT